MPKALRILEGEVRQSKSGRFGGVRAFSIATAGSVGCKTLGLRPSRSPRRRAAPRLQSAKPCGQSRPERHRPPPVSNRSLNPSGRQRASLGSAEVLRHDASERNPARQTLGRLQFTPSSPTNRTDGMCDRSLSENGADVGQLARHEPERSAATVDSSLEVGRRGRRNSKHAARRSNDENDSLRSKVRLPSRRKTAGLDGAASSRPRTDANTCRSSFDSRSRSAGRRIAPPAAKPMRLGSDYGRL